MKTLIEKELILKEQDIYSGNLILVNKNYPVKENNRNKYISLDEQYPDIKLNTVAATCLTYIFHKIQGSQRIIPISGYRTKKEQEQIYEDSLQENGIVFTEQYVALPNHSEHQTGLAIDLGLSEKEIDFIRPYFPYSGICKEFRKQALEYGFIERYGKEKEEITGIAHEPWHFRYVGFPHSKIMKDQVLALEEYTEFLKNFKEDRPFIMEYNHKCIEIFYVPMKNQGKKVIVIPEDYIADVSGNNSDGCIVTLWRNQDD